MSSVGQCRSIDCCLLIFSLTFTTLSVTYSYLLMHEAMFFAHCDEHNNHRLISSHHFSSASLHSRFDDASRRLPNHRLFSLRSPSVIFVRLLVLIVGLWFTTELVSERSTFVPSSIVFDQILETQTIQTQKSRFTSSSLVTIGLGPSLNQWWSTAHGHLRRCVESRCPDRKITFSSSSVWRDESRWLSITRVDVCGCSNRTTNTPHEHWVSRFVLTSKFALHSAHQGSECRQTSPKDDFSFVSSKHTYTHTHFDAHSLIALMLNMFRRVTRECEQ